MSITNENLINHNDYLKIFKNKININSNCWWCTYEFDTLPVCAPLKYNSKRDEFTVYGFFCSFSCAKAFLLYKNTPYIDPALITLLNKRLTGSFETIPVAPSIQCLTRFGGNMTIEEFRNRCLYPLKIKNSSQNLEYKSYEEMRPYGTENHSISKNQSESSSEETLIPDSPHLINEDLVTKKKLTSSNRDERYESQVNNTLGHFMKITEKTLQKK